MNEKLNVPLPRIVGDESAGLEYTVIVKTFVDVNTGLIASSESVLVAIVLTLLVLGAWIAVGVQVNMPVELIAMPVTGFTRL